MDDRDSVLAFPQAPDAIEIRHLRAFVAAAPEGTDAHSPSRR